MIFRVTIQTSSNLYTIYLYISNFQAIITYKVLFDMQLRHRSHNFSNIIQPIHNTSFKVILFDSLKKKKTCNQRSRESKRGSCYPVSRANASQATDRWYFLLAIKTNERNFRAVSTGLL